MRESIIRWATRPSLVGGGLAVLVIEAAAGGQSRRTSTSSAAARARRRSRVTRAPSMPSAHTRYAASYAVTRSRSASARRWVTTSTCQRVIGRSARSTSASTWPARRQMAAEHEPTQCGHHLMVEQHRGVPVVVGDPAGKVGPVGAGQHVDDHRAVQDDRRHGSQAGSVTIVERWSRSARTNSTDDRVATSLRAAIRANTASRVGRAAASVRRSRR